MQNLRLVMLSGVLGLGLTAGLAGIGQAEPLVIPGYGPAEAQATSARARYGQATRPAAPQRMAQLAPQNGAGRYGGGFFEMLASGGPMATAPVTQPVAYAPATPTYGAGYGQPFAPAPAYGAGYGQAYPGLEPAHGVDPAFRRQDVAYDGPERPGTIIVDTPNKFLFLVEPGGRALRYGIGVGRPGFAWAGVKTITRKAEWPGWTPPPEMLKRRPDLPTHMVGGPENPLGARALYLGSSLYRIHGTNEPETIGQNVSSGCIRLMNEDVTDLYERVGVGTRVIVM